MLLGVIACDKKEDDQSIKPDHNNGSVFTGDDGHVYKWKDCQCEIRGAKDWEFYPSANIDDAKGCLEYSQPACDL